MSGVGDVASSLNDLHSRRRYQRRDFGDHGGKQPGALGPVRQQQGHIGYGQRGGVDRQGCLVVHLVEEGGGVRLQHRPERLRELVPRARPQRNVLDEVLGSVTVVPPS